MMIRRATSPNDLIPRFAIARGRTWGRGTVNMRSDGVSDLAVVGDAAAVLPVERLHQAARKIAIVRDNAQVTGALLLQNVIVSTTISKQSSH